MAITLLYGKAGKWNETQKIVLNIFMKIWNTVIIKSLWSMDITHKIKRNFVDVERSWMLKMLKNGSSGLKSFCFVEVFMSNKPTTIAMVI